MYVCLSEWVTLPEGCHRQCNTNTHVHGPHFHGQHSMKDYNRIATHTRYKNSLTFLHFSLTNQTYKY